MILDVNVSCYGGVADLMVLRVRRVDVRKSKAGQARAGDLAVEDLLRQIPGRRVVNKLCRGCLCCPAARIIKRKTLLHERESSATAQVGLVNLIDDRVVEERCRGVVAVSLDSVGRAFLGKVPDPGDDILVFARRRIVPPAALVEPKHFVTVGRGWVRNGDPRKAGKLAPGRIVESPLVRVRGRAAQIDTIDFAHGGRRLNWVWQQSLRIRIGGVLPIVPRGRWFVFGCDGPANSVVDGL